MQLCSHPSLVLEARSQRAEAGGHGSLSVPIPGTRSRRDRSGRGGIPLPSWGQMPRAEPLACSRVPLKGHVRLWTERRGQEVAKETLSEHLGFGEYKVMLRAHRPWAQDGGLVSPKCGGGRAHLPLLLHTHAGWREGKLSRCEGYLSEQSHLSGPVFFCFVLKWLPRKLVSICSKRNKKPCALFLFYL